MDAADAFFTQTQNQIYECKARGVFRNKKIKPLVGDFVEIEVLDEEKKLANIEKILERKNALIRPAAANVDQVVMIFAVKNPEPNLGLVDRFLLNMEAQETKVILVLSKIDLDEDGSIRKKISEIYQKAGYESYPISTKTGEGMDELRSVLEGKTSVLSGPSGVGKSSLINVLKPGFEAEVGSLSEKISRGKNTTRHTELLDLSEGTRIMDTPGYSSIELITQEEKDLQYDFREFLPHIGNCKFTGCMHMAEPGCAVKAAVEDGLIAKERYESYKKLYEALKDRRKW